MAMAMATVKNTGMGLVIMEMISLIIPGGSLKNNE